MSADCIEVVPTKAPEREAFGYWQWRNRFPSKRPHFIRRVDGSNGKTEWVAQAYETRSNAVRAARHAAQPEGLAVVVLDATGEVHRRIEPGT